LTGHFGHLTIPSFCQLVDIARLKNQIQVSNLPNFARAKTIQEKKVGSHH